MNTQITISGISPILCNKFTDEAALKQGSSSAIQTNNKGTPREQAAKKIYSDTKGFPVIPGPNIFRAIIDAGAFHKSGKGKITTARSSLIPAGIAISEIECVIVGADGPAKPAQWEVDSRSVVIPSTGGRIMCHRPRFDQWALTFTLEIDETFFNEGLVRQLVDDAGKRVGLGDFRPSRKGPFGRFVVTAWNNVSNEKPAKKAA